MSFYPNREIPNTPKPENSSAKEVFSFSGLCMFNAQVLEQGLVNLAVGLIAEKETKLTSDDFDKFFNEAGSKTLGQLIYDLRKQINFSEPLEKSLIEAKNQRNFVAHNFFVKHDINFMSEQGRKIMIEELINYIELFIKVDLEIEKITHQLWKKLGITQEMVQHELENMENRAKAMDSAS